MAAAFKIQFPSCNPWLTSIVLLAQTKPSQTDIISRTRSQGKEQQQQLPADNIVPVSSYLITLFGILPSKICVRQK